MNRERDFDLTGIAMEEDTESSSGEQAAEVLRQIEESD